MKYSAHARVMMSGFLLAAFAVGALAPAAEAKHRSQRYKSHSKRAYVVRHVHHSPVHVVRVGHSSDAFPAFAGFLGGLVLGTALSHASDPAYDYAPAVDYGYYDPYCRVRFASLEIYRTHLYHHRHPAVVRVIEVETGRCVHVCYYHHGAWRDWDDDRGEGWEDDYGD